MEAAVDTINTKRREVAVGMKMIEALQKEAYPLTVDVIDHPATGEDLTEMTDLLRVVLTDLEVVVTRHLDVLGIVQGHPDALDLHHGVHDLLAVKFHLVAIINWSFL